MHAPPPATNTPPSAATTEAPDRLEPRARLALRRTIPFARIWLATIGSLTALAFIVPLSSSGGRAPDRAAIGRLAADTLRSAQRLREAEAERATAESLLVVARSGRAARAPAPTPRPTAARPATPSPSVSRASGDPTVAAFSQRIDEARRLRTVSSWLAVAEHSAVSAGPRMRALADTLRALDARVAALPSGPERDQQLSVLQQRMGRTGYTILAIAENRRAELVAAGVTTVAAVAPPPVSVPTVLVPEPRAEPDPDLVSPADTAALVARLSSAVATLTQARRTHDSITVALRSLLTEAPQPTAARGSWVALSPAIAFATLLVAGLLARFGVALRRELQAPTLADATEASRLAGAPVLTVVRDAMLEGPARFRPSGVDPFRLLYLGLTATGTRARAAIVTGGDAVIAAAAGARLAIAAAADHRNTLVLDLDPPNIPLSRTFRERAEPGSSDALAGAFTWREVARPVGSSDGLPITLIPAGTERDEPMLDATLGDVRDTFNRFRVGYELAIIVTPASRMPLASMLLDDAPVILTAVVGETSLEQLQRDAGLVRSSGRKLHGVVLWDAPRPELPSRAELAAQLSKRKGRTPGGSFEAVQRVVRPNSSGTNKPQ